MHHFKSLLPQKKKKRDGAQAASPSSVVPHASGSASLSVNRLAVPLNSTDRPSSAPPIGHASTGRNEYKPSHLDPSESTAELPPESQTVTSAVQVSNKSVLPHLDLAAPRAVAPYSDRLILDNSNCQPPPVAHTSSALQDVNDSTSLQSSLAATTALSHDSLSASNNPIHRLPSLASTTATSQGATAYILHPLLLTYLRAPRRYHFDA
jgi:hypothetical protein